MAFQLQVSCNGVASMRSLTLFLLVNVCQAQTFYGPGNAYFETAPGSSDCSPGYQVIKHSKACKKVAEILATEGKYWDSIYHYYPVGNPWPDGCSTRAANDVSYYVNPLGVHTDPASSLLCIKSAFVCDVTDGTGKSGGYPCVCGTSTCVDDEICVIHDNYTICEVAQGYYETERIANSCPQDYQAITDQRACEEIAGKISTENPLSGFEWGAVYSFTDKPYGCATWTGQVVNYYVDVGPVTINPAGTNSDVDVSMLCMRQSMACSVTDGTLTSSQYPCICGTDTCSKNELCMASENLCLTLPGLYEGERKSTNCPSGYQRITDAAACQDIANRIGTLYASSAKLNGMFWGFALASESTNTLYGCGTQLGTTVNYYVNPPGGTNTDVDVAPLCLNSVTQACTVTDGSTQSAFYPCICGTETCGENEICYGSQNKCEVIKYYLETERLSSICPFGYTTINSAQECEFVSNQIAGKTWMAFYDYSSTAHGCGTWKEDTVNFFNNPGGTNTEVRMAPICKTSR
mmetsp:Transcript_48005/g.89880  ORF Transcript_48005/g.89880 Transcript_48005/m.89880 type:complete len:520 (+) Transcript_48005:117-1676(+)